MNLEKIISNRWFKTGISLLSIPYLFILVWFSQNSFLYTIDVHNPFLFLLTFIVVNALFLLIMLYTRKEIITGIVAMLALPAGFLIFVMNLDNLIVPVPFLVTSIIIFIICRTQETLKTVLAAIYILMYVLGTLSLLIVNLLFGSSVETTILTKDVKNDSEIMEYYSTQVIDRINYSTISPDGSYRFYVEDVIDKSLGRVEVYVVPNNMDKEYSSFTLVESSMERRVSYAKGRGDSSVPVISWVSDNELSYQYPNEPVQITKIEDIEKDLLLFLYE